MTVLLKLCAASALVVSVAACENVEGGGAEGGGWAESEPYAPHGSKGVTPEQAEWLGRGHTRPAGR